MQQKTPINQNYLWHEIYVNAECLLHKCIYLRKAKNDVNKQLCSQRIVRDDGFFSGGNR